MSLSHAESGAATPPGITGAQGLFHEIGQQEWRDTLEIDFVAAVALVRFGAADRIAVGSGSWVEPEMTSKTCRGSDKPSRCRDPRGC